MYEPGTTPAGFGIEEKYVASACTPEGVVGTDSVKLSCVPTKEKETVMLSTSTGNLKSLRVGIVVALRHTVDGIGDTNTGKALSTWKNEKCTEGLQGSVQFKGATLTPTFPGDVGGVVKERNVLSLLLISCTLTLLPFRILPLNSICTPPAAGNGK